MLLLLWMLFPAQGQTKDQLEKQKQETLKELEIAKELLKSTRNERTITQKKLAVISKGINSRARLISTISAEINEIDEEITTLESQVDELKANIGEAKQEYAAILYVIYKNHTEEEKLMYLLASENINQFYQRIKYLRYLTSYRENKVKEIELLIYELEDATDRLIIRRNERAELLSENEAARMQLEKEKRSRTSMIQTLSREERSLQKQITEKERIRRELEDKIRKMIEEEMKKRSGSSMVLSLTPEQKLVGSGFLQNRGRLPWPVERGMITGNFGQISVPGHPGVKINNNGIDISCPAGSKARAIFDGEVTSVFAILGANYAIIVMHGEYLSVYQNLVDLQVKVGDKVSTKQVLGTVHTDTDIAVIHIQVWKSKEILNPTKWISK